MLCKMYDENKFLSYLRYEMNPQEIEVFEKHISECDTCAADLYRSNVGLKLL